jgi:hypothetical protein
MTNLNNLKHALKGGTGSGHHGHSGRPGKRGGSSPGGGSHAAIVSGGISVDTGERDFSVNRSST